MSDLYQFVFGAPRTGDVPLPARWAHRKASLNSHGEVAPFMFSDGNASDLAAQTYCEVNIDARGENTSGTIVILVGKWPVPCAAAIKVELGRSFDAWRNQMGYTPYGAIQGMDHAARKLRFQYASSGLLTVTGDMPTMQYDLAALSVPGDDQQLHVVVIPESGSTLWVKINEEDEVTVTAPKAS